MIVKTQSDGDFSSIIIEDSGKHYTYELQIYNNADGSCSIFYENADGETYTLLRVDKGGAIVIDKPTLE